MNAVKTLGEELLEELENGRVVSDEELKDYIRQPDENFYRAISAEELLKGVMEDLEEIFKTER